MSGGDTDWVAAQKRKAEAAKQRGFEKIQAETLAIRIEHKGFASISDDRATRIFVARALRQYKP